MRYPNICFWNPILPDMTCTLLAPTDWQRGQISQNNYRFTSKHQKYKFSTWGHCNCLNGDNQNMTFQFRCTLCQDEGHICLCTNTVFGVFFVYFWTPNTPFCPHFVKRFDMFFLRPSSPQLLACVVLEFRCKHSYSRGKSYSENLLNHTN